MNNLKYLDCMEEAEIITATQKEFLAKAFTKMPETEGGMIKMILALMLLRIQP